MMTESEQKVYDNGVVHGMSVTLASMVGSTIQICGVEAVPMLAAVMGRSFMPYIDHLERLDPNTMPRNIRKFVEILIDLASDVREKQRAAKPSVVIPG